MPKTNSLLSAIAARFGSGADKIFDPATVVVALVTALKDGSKEFISTGFELADTTFYPKAAVGAIKPVIKRLDGRYTVEFDEVTFVANASLVPITFIGFVLQPAEDSANVLAYGLFDQPIVFLELGNSATVVVRLSISNPAGDVEYTVVNG